MDRKSEYYLMAIVPVIPESDWTSSIIKFANSNNIPYVKDGEVSGLGTILGDNKIDLAFSVFYEKLIQPDFILKCERILNYHIAPLPKYRGVRPINWALKNGETEHGVTIHELTEEFDQGPILSQVIFPIYPDFDEVIDVFNRSMVYGYLLFQDTMPILEKIKPKPQDESVATKYYSKDNIKLGARFTFTKRESLKALSNLK